MHYFCYVIMAAGTGTQGYSGDGGAATSAKIDNAEGLTADTTNKVYVSASGISYFQINSMGL